MCQVGTEYYYKTLIQNITITHWTVIMCKVGTEYYYKTLIQDITITHTTIIMCQLDTQYSHKTLQNSQVLSMDTEEIQLGE